MAEDSPARRGRSTATRRAEPVSPAGPTSAGGSPGRCSRGCIVWGGAGWLLDRWLETRVSSSWSARSSAWRWPSTWWSSSTAPPTRLPGVGRTGTTRGRAAEPAAGVPQDAEGTTVTSSALALVERARRRRSRRGQRLPGPDHRGVLPGADRHLLARSASTSRSPASRSSCGSRPRRCSRCWSRPCASPTIVPGKLQYLGESGYSLVRDGMARDVIGPKGLPFAPFLASLFFFILANNAMSHHPVRADLRRCRSSRSRWSSP